MVSYNSGVYVAFSESKDNMAENITILKMPTVTNTSNPYCVTVNMRVGYHGEMVTYSGDEYTFSEVEYDNLISFLKNIKNTMDNASFILHTSPITVDSILLGSGAKLKIIISLDESGMPIVTTFKFGDSDWFNLIPFNQLIKNLEKIESLK